MQHVSGPDLYMRQGSILGIAELIQALSEYVSAISPFLFTWSQSQSNFLSSPELIRFQTRFLIVL